MSNATANAKPRAARRFDVVVWGATGFTGQLVAEYLVKRESAHARGRQGNGHGHAPLAWAIGGRSREKLERVRAELVAIDPAAKDIPIVTGDSRDRASLDAIVSDTRVVLTTVGPYAIHGRELVAACVDAKTDYCDLTGEPPFIRDMIDAHHARARSQTDGARIVHCCGYDSIPSDLGVLVLQEHAKKKNGGRCSQVKYFAGESKGGMSGGTVASMLHLVEQSAKDPNVRRVMSDPYSLDPDREGRGPDGRDQRGVKFDPDLARWTAPFVMAAINARIVRRSNGLLDYAWGKDFRYGEAMSFPPGPKGFVMATGMTAGLAGFVGAMSTPPLRKLLAKTVLPSPGEGPSRETRESGYFTSRLVGIAEDGARSLCVVKGTADPGYGETAKMISESALCLALEGDAIGAPGKPRGGVLTPASCMGMRLVERLRAAGMTFDVSELAPFAS